MRISAYNDGPNPIRVIIDGDETAGETILESGDEHFFDSRDEGVIEFRELAGPLAHASGDAETEVETEAETGGESDAGNAAERAVHHEPGTT